MRASVLFGLAVVALPSVAVGQNYIGNYSSNPAC
jgi:hypothetical protein